MDKHANERGDFFVLQSHRHYHLIILATGFLIFLFVPLFILTPGQSKQVFNNGREFQVITDILTLIGLFFAVVAVVYWLFTLMKRREIAASLIRLLFCWVALSGFLFPLTINNGMFELVGSPLHKLNLTLVLISSLGLTVLWGSKYVKTVTIFLATFLFAAIFPTLPRAFSQFESQSGGAPQINLSQDHNLLLVGMDGVPGHIAAELLGQNAEMEATFKDFIFYENAIATSPATEASLMGVIYGNHDFTSWEEPFPINWRDFYFNDADKYNFYTMDKFNIYNETGTKLTAGRYGVSEQRNELFELYRFVAVRLFAGPGINSMLRLDLAFPNRGGKFYWTTAGFDTILDSVSMGSDRDTILFSHFAFTHWPASIDKKCRSRKMDDEWMGQNTNTDGVIAGTKCAFDKYKNLLDKLKSMNVYDNTTIIFFSDHGKPVLYYDQPPHNLRINGHLDYGFDRYRPFIMIKPAGEQKSLIAYENRNVILDDLAQTSCYIMQPTEMCEKLTGVNLLDNTDVAPDSYYIHVVKDITSRWFVQDQKAVQLSRKMPLEAAMRESVEIELTEQPKR